MFLLSIEILRINAKTNNNIDSQCKAIIYGIVTDF